MWQKIFSDLPDMKVNVTKVHTDFERSALRSVKESFSPTCRQIGCLFHYKQALIKYWSRLRIEGNEKILEYALALAYLRHDLWNEGVTILFNMASTVTPINASILEFVTYIRQYWLPIANKVSVFKCTIKTTNICES